MKVWPAELPAGARWLPYSVEPPRHYSTSLPPMTPIRPGSLPTRVPVNYWRLVLAAVIGAGLIGIGGGMAAASIFGAR